jgi:hypothetical protein
LSHGLLNHHESSQQLGRDRERERDIEKDKEKNDHNKQKKKFTVPKSPKFSTMSWQKKQEQLFGTAGNAGISGHGEDRRKSGAGLNATNAASAGVGGLGGDKRRSTSTGRMRL